MAGVVCNTSLPRSLVFSAWYQPLSPTNNTVIRRTKLPESGTVIRKLSFVLPQVESLIFAYCGAILALPEGTLLWLQRCDFRTVKESFPLTTAAQNMHVLLRKLPLY